MLNARVRDEVLGSRARIASRRAAPCCTRARSRWPGAQR